MQNETRAQKEQRLNNLIQKVNFLLTNFVSGLERIDWRTPQPMSVDMRIRGIVNEGFYNKFFDPASGLTEELHKKALSNFLEYDDSLIEVDNNLFSKGDGYLIESIIERLAEVLKGYESLLCLDDAWPGPGETFFSSRGNVSPIGKFSSDWSVTENCLDTAIICMATNRHLLQHVLPNLDIWDASNFNSPLSLTMIKDMLKDIITVVPGNRFFTVFQNSLKRRVACSEPLLNSCVQRVDGRALRKCLLLNEGVDLNTLAYYHHDLLRQGGFGTGDLSNASNSVTVRKVDELFPGQVSTTCKIARAPAVTWELEGVHYMKNLNMISSMGCGFTFELMTVLLYSALTCRYVKKDIPFASVFGDDIIVPTGSMDRMYDVVESLGFIINRDKSFDGSKIAESCGLYVVEGHEVERFDFKWVESPIDLISVHNKLCVLIDKYPHFPESRHWKVIKETIATGAMDWKGPKPKELPRNVHGQITLPSWLISSEGTARTSECVDIEANLQLTEHVYEVTAVEQRTDMFTATNQGDLSMAAAMQTMMTPMWWRRRTHTLVERKYYVKSDGTILWSKGEYYGRAGSRKRISAPIYNPIDPLSDQYLMLLSMVLGDHVRDDIPVQIGHGEIPRDDQAVKEKSFGRYISLRKMQDQRSIHWDQMRYDLHLDAMKSHTLSVIRHNQRYEREGVVRIIERPTPRLNGIVYDEINRQKAPDSRRAGHVITSRKANKPGPKKARRGNAKKNGDPLHSRIRQLEQELKQLKSKQQKGKSHNRK